MNKFQKLKRDELADAIDEVHDEVVKGKHTEAITEVVKAPVITPIKKPLVKRSEQPKADKAMPVKAVKIKDENKASKKNTEPKRENELGQFGEWVSSYVRDFKIASSNSILNNLFTEGGNERKITSVNYPTFLIELIRSGNNEDKLTYIQILKVADFMVRDISKDFSMDNAMELDKALLVEVMNGGKKVVNVYEEDKNGMLDTSAKALKKYQVMICSSLVENVENGEDIIRKVLAASKAS